MRGSPSSPDCDARDRREVRLLEVQAVGDHQLDAARGRQRAIIASQSSLGHRHRLLAQHVHAGPRGAHGVLAVQVFGQRDEDGVDLAPRGTRS